MGLTPAPRMSTRSGRRILTGDFPYDLLCFAGAREQAIKIADSPAQAFLELHRRQPMQDLFGAGDVGAALPGVVLWQRSELEPRARADEGDDKLAKLRNGCFEGIA